MMNALTKTLAIITTVFMASNSYAHYSHYDAAKHYNGHRNYYGKQIRDRLERQDRRIEKGIKNGSLTYREVKKLRRKQGKFAELKRYFLK